MQYLALIRGINVGGNSVVGMADLSASLEGAGFEHVRTYIQSGNVFLSTDSRDQGHIATTIATYIEQRFGLSAGVAVFTKAEWQRVIDDAPAWWGTDDTRKHNIFVLLKPYDMQRILEAISTLNEDVETVQIGEGVLYQSLDRSLQGRVTTSKLAASPLNKQMTVRNFNTATKLVTLFD